jgi:hypothetical protein
MLNNRDEKIAGFARGLILTTSSKPAATKERYRCGFLPLTRPQPKYNHAIRMNDRAADGRGDQRSVKYPAYEEIK